MLNVGTDEIVVGLVEVSGEPRQGVESVSTEPAGERSGDLTLSWRVGGRLEQAGDRVGGLRV